MAKICAWWYSGGWFYAGAQCWATGQKSDCNDVNRLADKVHSSCKDFVCEAFIGFSNSYRGRARERQQTPCGNGAPGALGSQLQRSWLALGCVCHFPETPPNVCKAKERKKKLRQRQTKPMVCTKQRGSPWDFLAAWLHRAVPMQDGHIALPSHRPGAGGLRVGLVKAGPSHFFSTGRSEVCLSSCTSLLATACLRGLPGCAPTGRHQPTAR